MNKEMIKEEYEKGNSWARAFLDEQEKREKIKEKEKKAKERKKNFRKSVRNSIIMIMAALMLYQVYHMFIK